MRIKTRGAKPRFSKSSRRSSSATIATPPSSPTPDYSSKHEDNADNISVDGGEGNAGDDFSNDETNVYGKMYDCLNWLEEKTCLICDTGGELLLCSGTGCPVALHKECIGCKRGYDEKGNYYCPFCWCKLQLSVTEELKKKALMAKKALEGFLDHELTEVGDNGKEKQSDGKAEGNQSIPVMEENLGCDNLEKTGQEMNDEVIDDKAGFSDHKQTEVCDNSNEKQNDGRAEGNDSIPVMGEKHGCNNLEKVGQETNGVVDDKQDEGIVEDGGPTESLNLHCVEEKTTVDGEVSRRETVGENSETMQVLQENQVTEEVKDKRHEDSSETIESYPSEEAAQDEAETADADNKTMAAQMFSGKKAKTKKADSLKEPSPQSEKTRYQNLGTTSAEEDRNQNEEVSFSRSSSKRKSVPCPYIPPLKEARSDNKEVSSLRRLSAQISTKVSPGLEVRKRTYWRPEEEEMLREGVQKFSSRVNKNLPWRKILEFGKHIFDPSRTPSDLKDKWRNIQKAGR